MTTLAPNDFSHLHVHSEFSLLDGLGRITELVDAAAAAGMDSMAITDHGALYGAVAFYQAARNKGIKPIIGVETYVAPRSMTSKEGKADSQPFHLILLAKDYRGYQNLCRLVTDAHIDGYYYKPRIDHDHLAKYSEGLIGLSACLGGEVAKALEVEDWELARKAAGEYGEIFGKDSFFLELQDHGLPEQKRLNGQLLRLAPEVGLPLVVTNDLHYVREEQSEAHDVLLCVGTGNNLDTPGRLKFDTHEFYVKTAAQMAALFPDQREAILNTRRIAEMTDIALPLGQLRIPHFPVPDGHTTETWLREECQRGLARRYGTVTPELQTRLDYELGVILSMGYAGYFLIVADFTAFARSEGIQTTCRGSAPGSIVTYTLGITPVDPILYQLPFERFLNPDRVTMPDIDVDFEDGRRDEVIAYVGRKYGQDHVAQIITFGTMLARAAIRDVGRVLGHSYGEVDRIAKAIPNQLGIKLDEALETAPALREQVDADPSVKRIIDFARHLEGVARNASTHAAGVVISREPLTELMPLQKATNSDGLMTQYEMHAIEALGHQPVRVRRLLERHQFGQWLPRDDDARRVGTRVASDALQVSGEVDDPLDRRVGIDLLAQGGRDLERLVEPDAKLIGDGLGDPVHLAVAVAEHAPDVPDGRAREHRAKGDDLGDVVLAVLAPDVGDDLIAPAVLEVDIDVGHRHPIRVEEALERQLVQDRVDRGDTQGVGDDASGRRSAARRLDALRAGKGDEVGDDQEVTGIAHRENDTELIVQAGLELRRHRSVTTRQAALALLP